MSFVYCSPFLKSVQIKKNVKRVLATLAVLLTLCVFIWWDLVVYGLRQANGQLNIVWNARPVEEFLSDPEFPDSLKTKLNLIASVRKYAIDSLSLKDTKNYKTLYDQKGQEIMWVVTASEEFKLKPKEWNFPVLGAVPYKGYFNKELAIKLRDELEKDGWDVSIRNPGGWSTLGWFTDPILSKMLERSEGDLANLIIHEMSHATIFVKDSIDFNENLSTFIGDRGAEKFLISKYGRDSKEYQQYLNEDKDFLKFSDHMLRASEKLDSLYSTMTEKMSIDEKRKLKKEMIERIVTSLDTLTLSTDSKPGTRYKNRLPNNAYFMNFRRYQSQQDDFWMEYRGKFNEDLKGYIEYLTSKYPFL
jgi:predicted aminopeptidase